MLALLSHPATQRQPKPREERDGLPAAAVQCHSAARAPVPGHTGQTPGLIQSSSSPSQRPQQGCAPGASTWSASTRCTAR